MNDGKRERQKKRKKERKSAYVHLCQRYKKREMQKVEQIEGQRLWSLKKEGDEKEKHKDKSVRRSEGEGGRKGKRVSNYLFLISEVTVTATSGTCSHHQ